MVVWFQLKDGTVLRGVIVAADAKTITIDDGRPLHKFFFKDDIVRNLTDLSSGDTYANLRV